MKDKRDQLRTPHEWDWFDKPKNRRLLWILLWSACVLSVVAELFIEREPHFPADEYFGSYALIGFAACALFILFAKGIGYLLKVKSDYYDE